MEQLVRFNDIESSILSYDKNADIDLVRRAYIFSAKAHEGHLRASGEPYLVHPLEVCMIVARDMKLGVSAIASALLHDTVEDTCATIEEIKEGFGEEVSLLVDGVTKLSSLEFGDTSVREAETYRKMILAMSKDIRVILVKLADRLHNMRTLHHLPEKKRTKISQETQDIYAPLANRLGLGKIKGELEDLALRYLEPRVYREISDKVAQKKSERLAAVEEAKNSIAEKLKEVSIDAMIEGRAKRLCSIYHKMTKKDLSFEEVMDLMAIRIITKSVSDCYAALGIIHSMWKPIRGEFDDYIAVPKPNMYQSLHTAVVWREGYHPLEIQIRTVEMHKVAEEGIAAHWKYKEKGKINPDFERTFVWLQQLRDIGNQLKDSKEFMKLLKLNLYPDDVYVFTPGGEVIDLPKGSSPIDFAYKIHTKVGHCCTGARVNGKLVQLKWQLKTGDICEIITSSSQKPNRDWLRIVKSQKATTEVKRWLKKEEGKRSLSLGREVCEKGVSKYNLDLKKLEKTGQLNDVSAQLGYKTNESLLVGLGLGKVSVEQIVKKIIPPKLLKEKKAQARKKKSTSIMVKGLDNIMIRFAKCCRPLPGDDISGFITRSKGATIHRSDCNAILSLGVEHERRIDVSWDVDEPFSVPIEIIIISGNRPGLLADISLVIASYDANIVNAQIKPTQDGKAKHKFTIEVHDLEQLEEILKAIRSVKNVFSVKRNTSS